jgi:hypothetical protein
MARLWSFTSGLLASGYLYAGWLRYPAPAPLIAGVYTAATVGLVLTIAAHRRLSGRPRQALQLAAIFAVIQLVATFAVHFPLGSGAQGRYLFPVIAPLMTLVVAGCAIAPDARVQRRQLMLAVLFAAVCDVIGWTTVLIPAYV